MTHNDKVKILRRILNQLVKIENKDNDTKEIVSDKELAKIKDIPREGILEALSEAIGNDKKRTKASVFIYSELTDIPEIEEVFEHLLLDSDAEARSIIIQSIRSIKNTNLVPFLNDHFYKETDEFCKDALLYTLTVIGAESSFKIFKELSDRKDNKYAFRVLLAFIKYQKSESKPYLLRIYNDKNLDKILRIHAAWGLAKLGEKDYIDYLIKMLEDPIIKTPKSYDPGQSIRAAQAISDILGWEFEWHKDSVEKVKERIKINAS
jgi:HEAT repeat protein